MSLCSKCGEDHVNKESPPGAREGLERQCPQCNQIIFTTVVGTEPVRMSVEVLAAFVKDIGRLPPGFVVIYTSVWCGNCDWGMERAVGVQASEDVG